MMKAKYKKYLDALKGVNLSSGQSNLSNAFSSAKTSMTSASNALSSSSYTELAAMTINNITIPKIGQALDSVESSASSAISSVISMVESLVGSLEALEALENESDSLGEKWSYNEDRSNKAKVDEHNARIDQVKKEIEAQEASIDGQIAAINGITVDAVDIASMGTGAADDTSSDTDTDSDDKKSTEFGDAVSISADGTLYWDGKTKYSIPTDETIAAKKADFIGQWDDKSQYTYYQGNNLYGRHNELVLFDNKTGEIINDWGEITLKPGETRVLTVKLPTDTGQITQITRTTADGNDGYKTGRVVTAKSDIDPDPNNIDYVRIVEGGYHAPSNMEWTENNCYDWVITATGTGSVSCSQTCLWSSEMTGGYGKRNLKAMINLKVHVVNDDSSDDKA